MEKTTEFVEISVENGTINNRRIETKVFLLFQRKKIKPSQKIWHKPTNRGKLCFQLQKGKRYVIETVIIKSRKGSRRGSAVVFIGAKGNIVTEEWRGNFCPQFSIGSH